MNKKIKLIFPDEVTQKVKTLCESIDYTEWSGILLYSVNGTILKPEEMVLEAKDIILMDKGTTVSTGFSFSEKNKNSEDFEDTHIDYCEENEEALLWKIGMIHSHHNMKSYFSKTDMEDLKNNSKLSNYYLSVVVNNNMDFVGKLAINTFLEEEVEVKSYALDDEGNKYHYGNSKVPVKKEFMIDYDCEIDYNKDIKTENSFWFKNIISILTKEDKKSSVRSTLKRFSNNNYSDYLNHNNYYKNDWGYSKNFISNNEKFKKKGSKIFQNNKIYEWENEEDYKRPIDNPDKEDSENNRFEVLISVIELFLRAAKSVNTYKPLFNQGKVDGTISELYSVKYPYKDLKDYLYLISKELKTYYFSLNLEMVYTIIINHIGALYDIFDVKWIEDEEDLEFLSNSDKAQVKYIVKKSIIPFLENTPLKNSSEKELIKELKNLFNFK